MREEPRPQRSQLHQPSQFVTEEDAVAHLEAADEIRSDDSSRVLDYAYTYLKIVKDTLENDKKKYIEFLQVMKDFKLHGVTDELLNRLKDVFEGYHSLLIGFNVFLPRGYENEDTSLDCPSKEIWGNFERAFIYTQKIKRRFQNDKTVYESFQQLVKMHRNGDLSLIDLDQQVKFLFRNHKDLQEEFTKYLPKPMDSSHDPHLQNSGQHSSGQVSGLKSVSYSYKENKAKKPKTVETNSNHHQIFQSPLREDVEGTSIDIDNGSLKNVNKERHLSGESMCKLRDRGKKRPSQDRETEFDGVYQCPDRGTLTSRYDVLMPEKTPMGQVHGSHGETSISQQKREFCKKVKKDIIDIELEDSMRNTGKDDKKDRHIDCDQSCSPRDELKNKESPNSSKDEDISPQGRDFCKKEKRKLSKTESENENKRNTEQHHGKNRHGDNDLPCRSIDKLNNNASTISSRGKGMNKPISEFCLSSLEHCTPSYCLLPENCLKPIASYSTKLAAQVLNDCCVTMTSGSEDNSFKHMEKNLYEESLFLCEDDRYLFLSWAFIHVYHVVYNSFKRMEKNLYEESLFLCEDDSYELDMLMESISATMKNIQHLLEKMHNSTINGDDHIQIEEHLTALNLRCIEQIYGDHGLELLDLLHGNPSRALPIIQKRLQQKKDELFNCKVEFNKVWAGVFAKNYQKSLDHRSFSFKQRDKKN